MSRIRFILALWAAKLSIPALKLTKHNGTNFPGEVALKLCPDFLKYVAKPKKIIAVTGTNGKTTVANLVCDILEKKGLRVLSNRYGSNINTGIATSLLSGCTLFNRQRYELAVLEVDERSSLRIYPFVEPDILVINNLFRDSVMRNAHPWYIADIVSRAVPAKTKLVINADDLIAVSVAPQNPRKYFGIEHMATDVIDCVNLIDDVRICPQCAGELQYDYRRYHHIGKAHCDSCGYHTPEYDYAGSQVDTDNMTMTISDSGGSGSYSLLSDSIFNIYNLVTVTALLRELGLSHEEIGSYMKDIHIVGSRYMAEDVGNVRIIMQMAKDRNALAISRALDYVCSRPGEKELFLMMHNMDDNDNWSENTTWLYECDFEFLNRDDVTHIVATGPRCKDYKLRMLLAGVPEEKIECECDELKAADRLRLTSGESVFILYGTDYLDFIGSVRDKIAQHAREAAQEKSGSLSA